MTEENTAIQIGIILKSIRKGKKLTQKDLSVIICGNVELHGLISRIENGAHKNVPFDKIYSILLALKIDLFELLTTKNK